MFRNYLAAALRNLVRNKFFAALNIFGLAVGFSAALFIALFVRDELSYDKWLPNEASIYILSSKVAFPGVQTNLIPVDIATAMKLDFPGIDKVVRLAPGFNALRHGDVEYADQPVYFADPDFFAVMQLPALTGDLKTALNEPDSVVVTMSAARKYFGKDAPIGELLEVDRANPAKVTAVLKGLPSNTQFNPEVIFSTRSPLSPVMRYARNPLPPGSWNGGLAFTYFSMKPGASIDEVNRGLPGLMARHMAADIPFVGPAPLYTLPMTGQHLQPGVWRANNNLNPSGDRATIATFVVIGVLILFIAAVNFVNLSTARATRRAVEVGVRKATGAAPLDLVVQFIGESLLTVAFGMFVAMMAVGLALPAFNGYLRRTIVFDFWADWRLLAGILGAITVVGVAAGAYPAFVLSCFHPKAVLKSSALRSGASSILRSALVVLQFAILIGLILSTFAVYKQTNYALNRSTHMDTAHVHVIWSGCRIAVRDAILDIPGVESATCSGNQVLDKGGAIVRSLRMPDGSEVRSEGSALDIGTFEFYGVKPLTGRVFSPEFPGDRPPDPPARGSGQPLPRITLSMVVNETLARKLSPGNPAAAVGTNMVVPYYGPNVDSQIIGVVPDFALDATIRAIPPTAYYLRPIAVTAGDTLSVRLRPGTDEKATLAAIDRAWKGVTPERPIARYSMEQDMQDLNAGVIRQGQVFTAFAAVAVLVGVLGLFGLAAFTAERRTKEIGVRKALGAGKADILRLLLWQFTKPVLWANTLAWPGAYLVMHHWLEGFANHIDLAAWMFLGASVLALVIAIVTVTGHALLVARAQPVTALRYE